MTSREGENTATDTGESNPAVPQPSGLGLSGKLLVLTTLFVMVAEIMIYVPSIANFRIMWLNDRLAAAHTAALVLDAAPSGMVPESLAQQVLDSIGAKAVAMKIGQQRRLLATSHLPAGIDQTIDVRDVSMVRAIADAFESLVLSKNTDIIRAIGPAPMGGEFVEIVLEEGPLRQAMWRYLAQHSAAVAGDLGVHRRARLSRAAFHVRAADAPHDHQHDGVPPRAGESRPRHRAVAPSR